jgi:hypothetical protein
MCCISTDAKAATHKPRGRTFVLAALVARIGAPARRPARLPGQARVTARCIPRLDDPALAGAPPPHLRARRRQIRRPR